ncbi:MBL fold metallo-hydrolase [Phenylobacterium sp.]|uniref:MBL fold metallo-hydrolase n=1 Tax=Phenylobacterium sp. TaxID=1871053 RepID=UPI00286BA6BE|nr:MBL fold metallo-hydrolase [Phenylobacterium sp.]
MAVGAGSVATAADTCATAEDAQAALVAQVRAALQAAQGTKLVLLGTGAGPAPGQLRRMTSHLMVSNGAAYVLDCGLGLTNQFARTGTAFKAVRGIFITHHHPDHNIEYGPFLEIGWVRGMLQSVRAFGPPPLAQMTEDFLRSQKATIDFWAEDFQRPPLQMIEVRDLPTAGPVMQDENVKVTSVLVQHPPVTPAYGYRFDFHDRSIAFSGDTVPLEAVAQMAKGADVLVHEAINFAAVEALQLRLQHQGLLPTSIETAMLHMHADHSPAEEVGRIAQEAGVRTLVISHLAPGDASVSDAAWRAAAARIFKGEIIVGHDLMVI